MQKPVLLDATAVPADRGGVGRYVDGLVPALDQAGARLAIVCQRSDQDHYVRIAPHAEIIPGPAGLARRSARLAWEQTGLPLLAQRVKAGVIHAPHYTAPLRASCPVVVTVHDATFFTEPEHYEPSRRTFYRSAIKAALHRATRVITPSKSTRDELVRLLAADSGRLDVIHHGVDTAIFGVPDAPERERVRARLGLTGALAETEYLAFLGTQEPRTNVPNLIRGWQLACRGRVSPPALALAGGSGYDDEIETAVAELPPELRLIRPGYLRYADLRGYLGGALLVAYPSHGEGFGLPVLEAMACGAPVLTTVRLSLAEVGGDAVAYTREDAESIAIDLAALLDDAGRRAQLSQAGRERAACFTWESSAQAHLVSYDRAASDG